MRLLPPAGHLVNYRTETNDVNNSSKIFIQKKADVQKLRSEIFTRVNKVEKNVLQLQSLYVPQVQIFFLLKTLLSHWFRQILPFSSSLIISVTIAYPNADLFQTQVRVHHVMFDT